MTRLEVIPEAIVDARDARRGGRSAPVEVEEIGTRDEILYWLGSIAHVFRHTEAEYYALLSAAQEGGRIVDLDEANPWEETHLRQLAKEAARWSPGERGTPLEVRRVRARPSDRHYADELIEKELRDLEYLVSEILPEGLGVVAGAPKVGKSWLTFQAALEISVGGDLLGRPVDARRPVLYYGLEDGERRFQKRLKTLVGGRDLDLSFLELRYEAPTIGAGLEADIERWLDDNAQNGGGAVFIDVLAKVRPTSKGKGNAYDEDYAVIGPLQTITKERPGTALVVVTHDRKAGSEDFLTTVTGTRGVTGAADWIWVVKRDRLKVDGVIYVTGRDIERDCAVDADFTGPWSVGTPKTGRTAQQEEVADVLRTEGDMTVWEIVAHLHPDDPRSETHRSAVNKKVVALKEQGWVVPGRYVKNQGNRWHVYTQAERDAELETAKSAARTVIASNNGAMHVTRVTRAIASARVMPPSQASQASHPVPRE